MQFAREHILLPSLPLFPHTFFSPFRRVKISSHENLFRTGNTTKFTALINYCIKTRRRVRILLRCTSKYPGDTEGKGMKQPALYSVRFTRVYVRTDIKCLNSQRNASAPSPLFPFLFLSLRSSWNRARDRYTKGLRDKLPLLLKEPKHNQQRWQLW